MLCFMYQLVTEKHYTIFLYNGKNNIYTNVRNKGFMKTY